MWKAGDSQNVPKAINLILALGFELYLGFLKRSEKLFILRYSFAKRKSPVKEKTQSFWNMFWISPEFLRICADAFELSGHNQTSQKCSSNLYLPLRK